MKTILVIEDEPAIRESLQDLLELEGYHAIAAANGRSGVELAQRYLPDLILCDVTMPELDGYTVLSMLQQSPATRTIPFIFLTARSATTDQRHGMNLGADDYLAKPCSAAEVLRAIASRFDKQTAIQSQSQRQMQLLRTNIAQSLPHEFYTPLNGILGFSEILYQDSAILDRLEIQELAEGIHTSAVRLYRLIQNFLLYTKLELILTQPAEVAALRQEMTPHPAVLIWESATRMAEQVDRLPDLTLHVPRSLPDTILAIAPLHFQKLVEELIENAFKFSPVNTPVDVYSHLSQREVVVEIRNRGRGMTPDQIADLGAYMQFDRRLYEQQGLGLGLIIAKRILDLYDGTLHIQSVPQPLLSNDLSDCPKDHPLDQPTNHETTNHETIVQIHLKRANPIH
ncbi:MAG: response regulator [Synechococcales cyanobacterium M58_A2018_015]|nr:response regulator [Synechococcales cyanobacterium M58_A2018_015]